MLDPTPPYLLFEDNGDNTMTITMDMTGIDGTQLPEGTEWPQTFLFPMGFSTLADNFIPKDRSAEMQQEFAEKVVHIPNGVDE